MVDRKISLNDTKKKLMTLNEDWDPVNFIIFPFMNAYIT